MDDKIAVVVEVQTTWPKHDRMLAWPCYVTRARAVHDCKAFILVLATNTDASHGSDQVIEIGQYRFDLLPHVVGGHFGFPAPGGPVFAPELTVLNILIGELDLSIHEARVLALANIQYASPDRRERYVRFMRAFVSDDIRLALEELMETVFDDPWIDGFIEEGIEKGIEKGRIEEAARALLVVLGARGISVLDQFRTMISACTDPEQFDLWISRASTATTINEVFAA